MFKSIHKKTIDLACAETGVKFKVILCLEIATTLPGLPRDPNRKLQRSKNFMNKIFELG